MIFDENGSQMLEKGISEYELYPYGSYVYGKTNKGWNVYNLDKYASEANDPSPMCKIYFKNCSMSRDGATLLGFDGDIYLSRTDEGMLCFFNLSEEERERARQEEMDEQELQYRNKLILMLFMNNMMATQSQINQMNNIYNSYNSHSRSRDAIERDIAKYQERIEFCESHMNDGIAEGMGYTNIIGNYNRMIQERHQELSYAH